MKEIPISFTTPLVKVILTGNKTQTRRIINPQPELCSGCQSCEFRCDHFREPLKQVWSVGDRLWVQENYSLEKTSTANTYICKYDDGEQKTVILDSREEEKLLKRRRAFRPASLTPLTRRQPGRFMYRSCSRVDLEITNVRVERLQDISEEDAIAEGCSGQDESIIQGVTIYHSIKPYYQFKNLWESINGVGSWDLNPYVWVIEFRRAQ